MSWRMLKVHEGWQKSNLAAEICANRAQVLESAARQFSDLSGTLFAAGRDAEAKLLRDEVAPALRAMAKKNQDAEQEHEAKLAQFPRPEVIENEVEG